MFRLVVSTLSSTRVSRPQGDHLVLGHRAYARRILALNEEASAAMVGAAQDVTLRLGLPEDFASGPVARALASFAGRHPRARLEVTSGLSRDLYRSYLQGDFDLVLVKQRRGEAEGIRHWPEPLAWFEGAESLEERDPLPLVAFPTEGLYRQQMIAALEAAGRRWRLVYTSTSLAGLLTAIDAGLGISLLPKRVTGPTHREIQSLPPVDAMEIVIHQADKDRPLLAEITALLVGAVSS